MKFNIIYADPPWNYLKGSASCLSTPYPTMRTSDICALPVESIAAEDSMLFMWATDHTLPDALKVMHAWGFKYSTVAFVWVKAHCYWGSWSLKQCEYVLLGTRGKPHSKFKNVHNIRQLINSPNDKHSRKPNEIRTRITQIVGVLPRVELFAREVPHGWSVWGNEVDSDITLSVR